jgi:hypothetical protein
MHLWLDLAASAARGRQPHRIIAGQIAHGFSLWLAARLDPAHCNPAETAATLLTTIEGSLVLDAVGFTRP